MLGFREKLKCKFETFIPNGLVNFHIFGCLGDEYFRVKRKSPIGPKNTFLYYKIILFADNKYDFAGTFTLTFSCKISI